MLFIVFAKSVYFQEKSYPSFKKQIKESFYYDLLVKFMFHETINYRHADK